LTEATIAKGEAQGKEPADSAPSRGAARSTEEARRGAIAHGWTNSRKKGAEVLFKIVYYGPSEAALTGNLLQLARATGSKISDEDPEGGDSVCASTLELSAGVVRGRETRLVLQTAPADTEHPAYRLLVSRRRRRGLRGRPEVERDRCSLSGCESPTARETGPRPSPLCPSDPARREVAAGAEVDLQPDV
jgi:hypothetical protein